MAIQDDILEHAKQCYPAESCGLIVIVKGRKRYIPCRNIATGLQFTIHPEDYADAEDTGVIDTVVHSHPDASPMPSPSDLIGCEKSGLKWLIVSYPNGNTYEFKPTGYVMPLYGRLFKHGSVDCYTFIRDYYSQELKIEIPDFNRQDEWWLKNENLYLDNLKSAGFRQVFDMKINDLILMTVGSQVPNHGAVYLGANKIGHHQVGRLSSVDLFDGWYAKIATHTFRHDKL